MDYVKVKETAQVEFNEELFRSAVEREKKWLRQPWFVRWFPWRLKIKVINLKQEVVK